MRQFQSSILRHIFWLMLIASAIGIATGRLHGDAPDVKSIYDLTVQDIDGNPVPLSNYRGKVLLIVNVASKCGHTPQYQALQSLYEKYKDRGLAILGFPANNFLWQEPGSNEQIKEFCTRTYGVTFDMFSKISVKGSDQAPLYKYLTSEETNPEFAGPVKWNFQKYLVNRSGKVVGRFSPGTNPSDGEVIAAIETALQ